ncbi:MAG: hypothetical protein A2Z99_16600 [Treponema sp. GWB1_62_6]|nr:MAG: hypothetical protein A2Y36_01365 [Treponema sp. GWA1_62_8]OHE67515.1 MAG: hypothetical protein A2Z99_16600 [Treponema sp. GWB1_62_6]OHE73161.1 MAG: hypothetical protein A2413_03530 [Treponema sp. RIFOXYC1_FULL_61_9]HCM28980.1 hypothetical protein [Treponema sp.]
MQVKDSEVMRLIERLGEHYRSNISNRYVRPALLNLPIDNQTWDLIESLTEKSEMYLYQGYHLDELYRQIAASASFVALARKDLAPSLRNRLGGGTGLGSDRVLREMAINNFASNLRLFADMVNELYVKLVEIDKEHSSGKTPLYAQMEELRDIGRKLVG